MILLYAFLCWLVFSHYAAKLYRAWESLHVELIKASMYKQFQAIKKSEKSSVVLIQDFSLYPKTWRSLWTELVRQGESQSLLVELALRTKLNDFCLASATKNLGFQTENATLLCLIADPEGRMRYLNSLPENSGFWQIALPSACYHDQDVAFIYLKRLLFLHQPRKASAILANLSSEKAKPLLVGLCRVSPNFRSFAVSGAVLLEIADQVDFIREAKTCGVDEVPFIKYFSRYSFEGQSVLRSTFSGSAWWYSRYILNHPGVDNPPPYNIAWFCNSRDLEVEARPHSDLPDIHIAA